MRELAKAQLYPRAGHLSAASARLFLQSRAPCRVQEQDGVQGQKTHTHPDLPNTINATTSCCIHM